MLLPLTLPPSLSFAQTQAQLHCPVSPHFDPRQLDAGFTHLVRADNLAAALDMKRLWVKDDSGNPTHSFKDRVVAVALSAAKQLGYTTVACASTGNLANAVAAASAAHRDLSAERRRTGAPA